MIESAVLLATADSLQVVGEIPLVRRAIQSLSTGGVRKIVIVTGPKPELVRESVTTDPAYGEGGVEVVFAHNPETEKGNGFAVLTGGAQIAGPLIIAMANHVFTPAMVRLVGDKNLTASDLYLGTDSRIEDLVDVADANRVRSYGGRILEIGPQLAEYDRIECGLVCTTPRLLVVLGQIRTETGDCALADGIRRLALDGRARVADIGTERWQRVHTPAGRDAAEAMLARP